ncbi:hypothetical protein L6452_28378 [Arctium lappa]|uniref:Uncharacterized protein n=1 Tax=Arctium lappa TaxID=4217 RepID=A0ACB8ZZ23_ARCLA|nr:hypothetical protein L6452_28378 [Arctium lappa]
MVQHTQLPNTSSDSSLHSTTSEHLLPLFFLRSIHHFFFSPELVYSSGVIHDSDCPYRHTKFNQKGPEEGTHVKISLSELEEVHLTIQSRWK